MVRVTRAPLCPRRFLFISKTNWWLYTCFRSVSDICVVAILLRDRKKYVNPVFETKRNSGLSCFDWVVTHARLRILDRVSVISVMVQTIRHTAIVVFGSKKDICRLFVPHTQRYDVVSIFIITEESFRALRPILRLWSRAKPKSVRSSLYMTRMFYLFVSILSNWHTISRRPILSNYG